jgi:hypothetical protein
MLLRDSKAFKLDPMTIWDLADISQIKRSVKEARAFKIVLKGKKMWFSCETDDELDAWLYDLDLHTRIAHGLAEEPEAETNEDAADDVPVVEEEKGWCQEQRDAINAWLPGAILVTAEFFEKQDEYYNPEGPLANLQGMSLENRLAALREARRIEEERAKESADGMQRVRTCVEDTEEKREDDQYANLFLRLVVAFQGAFMSYTGALVYSLLVVNHAMNGGVSTMVLPALGFIYFMSSKPRPPQWWWHLIIAYTLVIVSAQYMVKLPVFCPVYFKYAFKGDCYGVTDIHSRYLTPPYLFGIRTGPAGFLADSWLDLVILLAVGFHITRLKTTGRWRTASGKVADDVDLPQDSAGNTFLPISHTKAEDLTASPRPMHRTTSGRLQDELLSLSNQLPEGVSPAEYSTAKGFLQSKDYYSYMFFADATALVWTVFCYSMWYSSSNLSLANQLEHNNLDWSYVVMLIAQFLSLIVDRVFYLTGAMWFKTIFHIVQVVGYHVALLFVLEMQAGNATLGFFYLLKCTYFAFSALQIRDSYPQYTLGEYLTRIEDGEEPSTVQYYAYLMYRSCPFVFELRVLLNWACARTSLDLYQWFKLEDIHGQLFTTKCMLSDRKSSHSFVGQMQPCWRKVCVGAGTFTLLTVLLWLPLVIFSSRSVLMSDNPVEAASMHVSLATQDIRFPLYDVSTHDARNTELKDFLHNDRQRVLESYFGEGPTQVVSFPTSSDSVFAAPPPLTNEMVYHLSNPNASVMFDVSTQWNRGKGVDKTIAYKMTHSLSAQKRLEISTVLDTVISSGSSISASFSVLEIVPDIVRLPDEDKASELGNKKHSLLLTLNKHYEGQQWQSWWEMKLIDAETVPVKVSMLVLSSKVMGGLMGIGESISNLGIVGFYVSIVFVIGTLLRAFVSNLGSKVMFEDMEDVSAPMYLCKNIYLARQEAAALSGTAFDDVSDEQLQGAARNALVVEEKLYWELIRLYRQPGLLYDYTTLKSVAPEEEAVEQAPGGSD